MNRENAHSIIDKSQDRYATRSIARVLQNVTPSNPVVSVSSGDLLGDTHVTSVSVLQVTANPISCLKRYYSGLMVEMGFLTPDCRFVWL